MPVTVPIFDYNRRGSFWVIEDIYFGPNSPGRYVPKPNDIVFDNTSGWYRVSAVEPAPTYTPTLVSINMFNFGTGPTEANLFTQNPFAYHIYIDTTQNPCPLNFDYQFDVMGTEPAYVKVFRGSDITETGNVVSATLDGNGNILNENIPLVNLITDNVSNNTLKAPSSGFCTESLPTGEVVTVVVYSASGGVLGVTRMAVQRSNAVRSLNSSQRYITAIELVSPYLSLTDNTLLEIPFNLLVQSSQIVGKVYYSDGTPPSLLPIDGVKFKLFGIENYVSTIPEQFANLVLAYFLANDEFSMQVNNQAGNRVITRQYRIKTIEADGRYTVKLLVVPVWDAQNSEWTLTYYLVSLERNAIYDVTAFVSQSLGSTPFNGSLYNVAQNVTVSLNLQNLGSSFNYYQHAQTFKIRLGGYGSDGMQTNYWHIEYDAGIEYGKNRMATIIADPGNPTLLRLNVGNGFSTVNDWLVECYQKIRPLYLPSIENNAPSPTHVRVRFGNWDRLIPISNILLNIDGVNATLVQGSSLRLDFLAISSSSTKSLAVGSMTVKAL